MNDVASAVGNKATISAAAPEKTMYPLQPEYQPVNVSSALGVMQNTFKHAATDLSFCLAKSEAVLKSKQDPE